MVSKIKNFVNGISQTMQQDTAILTGTSDIIVVESEEGRLNSTSFHVRIGKLNAFISQENQLKLFINGEDCHLIMYVGIEGKGYFKTQDFKKIKALFRHSFENPEFVQNRQEELETNLITFSLCKSVLKDDMQEEAKINIFNEYQVSILEIIQKKTKITLNPNFMVKIGSQIYMWEDAKNRVKDLLVENNSNSASELLFGLGFSKTNENAFQNQENIESFEISNIKDKKTLTLPHKILKYFPLKYGKNDITYRLMTSKKDAYTDFHSNLYMYKSSEKLVISDIDGTITKSDLMGHLLPAIGKDWTQKNIVQLYNEIVKNGYHIVYLTARPIGRGIQTKEYLWSILQNDMRLPQGPVLVSPEDLLSSLKREVINKNPEVFKIKCLTEISQIFFPYNPFFAGFGNRESDLISYKHVKIKLHRIFIVNENGIIQTHQKSNNEINFDLERLNTIEMDSSIFEEPKLTKSKTDCIQINGFSKLQLDYGTIYDNIINYFPNLHNKTLLKMNYKKNSLNLILQNQINLKIFVDL